MMHIQNDAFDAERDIPTFAENLRRWRRPGGMIRAWNMAGHSYIGAYGESLGMLAPLQAFLLQSWDEVVRIFPLWKANIDAAYTNLRAEGAFLVSADWKDGDLQSATIHSEAGRRCRLDWPWDGSPAITCEDEPVDVTSEEFGVVSFDTAPRSTYRLERA